MVVYENGGPSGNIWDWGSIDVPSPLQGHNLSDCLPQNTLFGDMNGDGKADLGIIRSNGVIDFFFQQGTIGTSSFSWELCANKGISSGNKLVLADIDGDGAY